MRRSALIGGILVGAALLSGFICCPAAHAEESPASTLTLDWLLAEVEKQNPELASKRAEVRAADERPAQARAFEDPMLMMELWQVPVGLQQVPLMFTLKQPIPWPGKLRARAAVVEAERQGARAGTEGTARTLRLDATRAYHNYRLAVRSEGVLRDNQRLLAFIVASVNARYRVGRADLAELLKAQESLSSNDNLLLDVAQERDLAVAALNTLLARSPSEPLGTPITEPAVRPLPEESALIARALQTRPELRAIQALLAQAQARARAARIERAPDLAVWAGFMAMLRGGNDHTFTIGAQTTLPSWSLSKYGAAEREAMAQVAAQQAKLRQIEAQIRGEVRAAYLRTDTAARHIRLHAESLIPLSERSMRAAQAGYQTGRVELVLLLDTARMLAMHHLEYERYGAEFGQRLAELEAAVGEPLWTSARMEGGRR